jgi:trimeric autotransporter adhesin
MRERIIQIVLPAILLLSLAMPTASRAADRGATENRAAHPVPPTALAQLLNADNTLNLGSGFSGSLDVDGWTMHTDSNGSPRFISNTQATPPSVPDDAAWDSRFGLPGVDGAVSTIAISGTNVYVGGWFTQAGNVWANGIARWDGKNWSVLGDGLQLLDDDPTTQPFVATIVISGSDVYAGGLFNRAGDVEAHNIARWDGQAWHTLGDDDTKGVNAPVYAITVAEANLYVGGAFTLAGGVAADHIARWDGASWAALGGGATNGVDNIVYALASQGKKIYVGGRFTHAGGRAASLLATWDNSKWQEVGGGLTEQYHDEAYEPPAVRAIAISGDNVYIGGIFNRAGTIRTNNIIRWNGRAWYNLGAGIDIDFKTYRINAIAIQGADIYVGGEFSTVNGSYVNDIVRWDGVAWHALGAGPDNGLRAEVMALASDGSNVYVGSGPWRLRFFLPPLKQPPRFYAGQTTTGMCWAATRQMAWMA